MVSLKFSVVYSKQHSAHNEQKDQRMRQVVAYKRLKKLENHSAFRLTKVVAVAYILVFWISGRLWDVVPYERWSLMEIRLYVVIFGKI